MQYRTPIVVLVGLFLCGCRAPEQPAEKSAVSEQSAYQLAIDDKTSVSSALQAAAMAGHKTITIPAGTYLLREQIKLADLHNIEIDARGVTFIMADAKGTAITLKDCSNVTLHGLTLRYEQITTTQGTVDAVDPNGTWLDLTVHQGYPVHYLLEPKPVGYPFDPATRRWKAGTRDCYFASGEKIGANRVRLRWSTPLPANERPTAGDLMAFRGSKGRDFFLNRCAGMILRDITIKGGSGFCVHEGDGEGGNAYSRITVTYAQTPSGASEAPLVSSNADGLHSSSVRKGPTVEDCLFEGMPDDGIAINAKYTMVIEAKGKSLTVNSPDQVSSFRAGDPVRLIGVGGELRGEATVVSVATAEKFVLNREIDDNYFKTRRNFHILELDRELPAHYSDRLSNPAAKGSGFTLRNNTIRNNRAFGIRIRADRGTIENNTIEGSTMAALTIGPEIWWNSGDYSRDLTIRGNTFEACGYYNVGPWTLHPGIVNLSGDGDQQGGIAYGHQRITFEKNRFLDNHGINLLINGAQDVIIRGNSFDAPDRAPGNRGTNKLDTRGLIHIWNCRRIEIKDNRVSPGTAAPDSLIRIGRNVDAVAGLDRGIETRKPATASATTRAAAVR